MKTKVLQAMKPKVASLGFTKEEIESVVEFHLRNFTRRCYRRTNKRTDRCGYTLPKTFFQSAVTRIVNAKKKEETPPKAPKVSTSTETEQGAEPEDKFEKLLKVIEAQNAKIDSLVNKDVTASRRQTYSAMLKDLPEAIQKTKLKDFDRMSFKDQDDYDTFVQEAEADIPVIKQAIANSDLAEMDQPFLGKKNQKRRR